MSTCLLSLTLLGPYLACHLDIFWLSSFFAVVQEPVPNGDQGKLTEWRKEAEEAISGKSPGKSRLGVDTLTYHRDLCLEGALFQPLRCLRHSLVEINSVYKCLNFHAFHACLA